MGARSAIKALLGGWSSSVVRALAARPMTLTELSRVITEVSYPSLERRLGAMRLAGQIEPCAGNGRGRPYRVTDWLRRAVAPLAAAAGWERRFLAGRATPIGRLDVEAAFLLTIPRLALPRHLSGTCRLAVDLVKGGEHRLAGVSLAVREGAVVSCTSRLNGEVEALVTGAPPAWLRAVFDRDPSQLDRSGDNGLVEEVVANLHGALSGATEHG